MKVLLFLIMISLILSSTANATDLPFGVSLRLLRPISVTNVQALTFSNSLAAGTHLEASAIFNVQIKDGQNRSITTTVVESSVLMSVPGKTKTVRVGDFTISGPQALDAKGDAKNIRVEATANVLARNSVGNDIDTATLRVVYL